MFHTKRFVYGYTLLAGTLAAGFFFAGCKNAIPEGQNPVVFLLGKALGGDQKSSESLQQELLSADADVRRQAVLRLGQGGPAEWEITPKLLTLMAQDDPNPQVRAAAVRVLAQSSDRQALQQALPLIVKDPQESVRREAAGALGQFRDDPSMEMLLEMLGQDPQPEIRRQAAGALVGYRQYKAVTALMDALADEEFGVAYQSRQSLKQMTGQDYEYDQQAWRNWLSGQGQSFINGQQK